MELKFAVIFAAVDRMTDMVSHITEAVGEMGNKLQETGERVSRFGERMALTSALISEGAAKFNELSEKILEPAIGMDEAMTRLSAISGLTGGALDKVRESAIAFSDLHPGITAEGYITAFRPLLGVFGDVQKAMDATSAAARLAQVTGASAADAANLISVSFTNMGTGPKQFADMMAAATQKFGLMGDGMSQFTMLYSRMAGLALATNTSAPEMVALVAEASKLSMGRGAARVGSALTEFATAVQQGKVAGFDMGGGLIGILDQIAARTKGLEEPALFRRLVGMGLGSEAVNLVPLLKNLDELHSKLLNVADSSGSLDRMSKAIEKATGLHIERLHQNLSNLFDAIAKPALPAFNLVIDKLTSLLNHLAKWFEAHPKLGEGLTLGLLGLGAVLSVVATGMAVLGTFLTVIGSGVSAIGVVGTVLTALTGPIGWAILGIIALSAVLYKYWGPISGFMGKLWADIKAIFSPASDWMKNAGVKMMEMLASGIKSLAMAPVRAVASVIERIWDWLPHSPAKEGPFRYPDKIRIIEAIADTITADPLLRAVSGVMWRVYDNLADMHIPSSMHHNMVSQMAGALSAAATHGATHAWQSIKTFAGAKADSVLYALSGTESSYGKLLTNPTSSAIGPYQMTRGFRHTWGVSAAEAMDSSASTKIAKNVIFGHYLPEFGGNLPKALSAWHQGEGWVRAHGIDEAYVQNIARHMAPDRGGVAPTIHNSIVVHVHSNAKGKVDLADLEKQVHGIMDRSGRRMSLILAREGSRADRRKFS